MGSRSERILEALRSTSVGRRESFYEKSILAAARGYVVGGSWLRHEMVYDAVKGHCELCCAECPHQPGARQARHGRTVKQACKLCGVHLCTKPRGDWPDGMSCAQMWHSSRPLTGPHRPGAAAVDAASGAAGGAASGSAGGAVAPVPATAAERTRSCISASTQSAQESGTQHLVSESARKRRKRASVEVSYTGTRVGVVRRLQLDGKE